MRTVLSASWVQAATFYSLFGLFARHSDLPKMGYLYFLTSTFITPFRIRRSSNELLSTHRPPLTFSGWT
jgi:hypothetical protein